MTDSPAAEFPVGPTGLFDLGAGLPQWAQQGEETDFTLSLHGQYAGVQHWSIRPERGAVVARVETEFGGALPRLRVHQTSRLHPRTLALLAYSEGEGHRASLELTLDYRAGELRLRQRGEEVDAPLVSDYLDPVSLLLWLREWQAEAGERRVMRLIGGSVQVQCLPNDLLNDTPTQPFLLRPGGAGLWRSLEPATSILRLTQPTPFGLVDAWPTAHTAGERRRHSASGRERRRVS